MALSANRSTEIETVHRLAPAPAATANRISRMRLLTVSNLHALLIAFALAGYPLLATVTSALGIGGSSLAIAARAAVLILSILLIVPAISRVKRQHIKYLIVFAIFWMAYLMRLTADTIYNADQLSKAAAEYWVWAVGVCLIPSLALVGVSPAVTMPKAFKLTWLALGTAVGLAILFGSTYVVSFDGTLTDTGRLGLESLNPISAGHLSASLVILSGWYWWSEEDPRSNLKAASLLGMLAGCYLLIASASRGPLVALFCAILFLLLTCKIRKLIKILIVLTLFAGVLLPVVLRHIDFESLALVVRIIGSIGGEDLSVISRQNSFDGALRQFLSNPLLGDFLEDRATGFYPHNLVLEAFMATGLIGGLAFLSISIIAAVNAFNLLKTKSPYGWAALIYIQYLIGAQLSGAIYASSTFWTFSVLMLFSVILSRNSRPLRI